jgi:hypothetical protein
MTHRDGVCVIAVIASQTPLLLRVHRAYLDLRPRPHKMCFFHCQQTYEVWLWIRAISKKSIAMCSGLIFQESNNNILEHLSSGISWGLGGSGPLFVKRAEAKWDKLRNSKHDTGTDHMFEMICKFLVLHPTMHEYAKTTRFSVMAL